MARSWKKIKERHLTPKQIEESRKWAEHEVLVMNIRELRKLTGKTQVELSELSKITQGELSKIERRENHLVSTLKRYVEALGGELEISAKFGNKKIIIKGIGSSFKEKSDHEGL
jgi:transcriptional regulator with XRE-family HTH domain